MSLIAGVVWGFPEYEQTQLRKSVAAIVKNASLRMQDAPDLQADNPAITYSDAFRALDEHVSEAAKRSPELRMLDTSSLEYTTAASLKYIRQARELMRRQAAAYRARLEVSSSDKQLTNLVDEQPISYDVWRRQLLSAKNGLQKGSQRVFQCAGIIEAALDAFPAIRDETYRYLLREYFRTSRCYEPECPSSRSTRATKHI